MCEIEELFCPFYAAWNQDQHNHLSEQDRLSHQPFCKCHMTYAGQLTIVHVCHLTCMCSSSVCVT